MSTQDQKKTRAYYWSFIIGAVGIFAIRDSYVLIRLIAVGVFALALRPVFDACYDYFTAEKSTDEDREHERKE